jgi:hypothetical protein
MKKNPLLSVRNASALLDTTKWMLWHHSQDWGLTTFFTKGGQRRYSYEEVLTLAQQWKEQEEAEARVVLGLPEKII